MSAHAGNVPRWQVGTVVHDWLLGDVEILAVNPKHEPHIDYIVRRMCDEGPYFATYISDDSMIRFDELAELVLEALAGEDHGPGCDGPYNCTCGGGR